METNTAQPSSSGWRVMAAVMGGLFLMSGADGQQRVQAVFLLLACVSLGMDALWPALGAWVGRWLEEHPQARAALGVGPAIRH